MPRQYRILIVDDEPVIRDALRQALDGASYEVVTARNGAEMLLQALDGRPDLIMLDLSMPVLDGMATLAMLRANPATRSVPVVMSGTDCDVEVTRALAAGAEFCLHRPLALPEVRAIIGRLLLV